jgi:hypothetical protein
MFIDNEGIIDQKTLALYFLMSVAGVNEISSPEQVKSFIYRLQFIFKIMKIEPGHINVGELFFLLDKKNNSTSFTFADLKERLGIKIDMLELEIVSEEEFLKTIPYRYKYAYINEVYLEEQIQPHFNSAIEGTIFLNTQNVKYQITSLMKEEALKQTKLILANLEQADYFGKYLK